MKKITFLLLFMAALTNVTSQNLVPNPSFEEYYDCPQNQADFDVDFWFETPNNGVYTPDYYNSCATAGSNPGRLCRIILLWKQ